MGKSDKLLERVLMEDKNLRFPELRSVLESLGYTARQPGKGSSHYTFRKPGHMPLTIPKQSPMNRAYIKMTANAVREEMEEET